MKKVLIVENKISRIEENKAIVKSIEGIDNVTWATNEDFKEFSGFKELDEIPNNFWNRFDLLMIHRSYAVDINKLLELQQANEIRGKDVVFFSGGASSTPEYRISEKTGSAFLYIGASHFYSQHLVEFLQKYVNEEEINLQYIIDGNKWNMSILLNSRRLIEQKGIKNFFNDGRRRDILNDIYPQLGLLYDLYEAVGYNDINDAVEKVEEVSKWMKIDSDTIISRHEKASETNEQSRLSSSLDFDLESSLDPVHNGSFSPDAIGYIESLYENELNSLIEYNIV